MTNNEIVNNKPEFTFKDRAYIDVLLKQYEHLRAEVTQCIYLQHAAILGLYTFLGLFVVALMREVLIVLLKEGTTSEIILFNLKKLDPDSRYDTFFCLYINTGTGNCEWLWFSVHERTGQKQKSMFIPKSYRRSYQQEIR